MGLGDLHRQRRPWAVLALAGAILYAALIPGHIVSQATARGVGDTQAAQVARDAIPICHSRFSGIADAQAPAPNAPAPSKKKCPFCMGYAPFLAATVGGAVVGIVPVEPVQIAFGSYDSVFAGALTGLPQNRGPPLEL